MNRMFRNVLFYLFLFIVIIGVIGVFTDGNEQAEELNVKQFTQALKNGEIKEMTMQPVNKIMRITGELEDGNQPFVAQVPDNTDIIADITTQANEQSVLNVIEEDTPSMWVTFLTTMIPILIIGLLFFFLLSQAQVGGGGRKMNYGKSKANMYSEDKKKVRLSDVAEADEVK